MLHQKISYGPLKNASSNYLKLIDLLFTQATLITKAIIVKLTSCSKNFPLKKPISKSLDGVRCTADTLRTKHKTCTLMETGLIAAVMIRPETVGIFLMEADRAPRDKMAQLKG